MYVYIETQADAYNKQLSILQFITYNSYLLLNKILKSFSIFI